MSRSRFRLLSGLAAGFIGTCTAPAWGAAADEVGYVSGVRSAEDLVGIPDSPWIVTSGLSEGERPGSLFLIDRRDKTASVLFPGALTVRQDRTSYPGCPGPVNESVFSAHGIALRKGAKGKHKLYVMNHGGREAIEVFELDASGQAPSLTWTGCILLPEGVLANGVAPIPGGGIVVTHMAVPRYFPTPEAAKSPEAWMSKFKAGQLTGYAAEWSASSGWRMVPGTEASGPNGIETSPDGKWIWVANWPAREVVRVPARPGGRDPQRIAVKLDFLPDNLRWGDDGWLWVAGAAGSPADYFACWTQAGCRNDYRIARIDPASLKVEAVPHPHTLPTFGEATTALKLGDEVWLGAHPGDRVAYMPVKARITARSTSD